MLWAWILDGHIVHSITNPSAYHVHVILHNIYLHWVFQQSKDPYAQINT